MIAFFGGEAWAMDARGSCGMRHGNRLLSGFGTLSQSTPGPRLMIGGHVGNGAH